ncbi:efflux transporter outer membrane subunit [Ferrimonas balearica]|uniref:efflux transporter outer membrane subunit n=1 Tax=Ferrimonas balearica TaxID=44012 RepID=UPI001C98ED5B|nr:efflux transporter outer membrane subunit [Ferrimonas balearica]MBY5991470.1 efflux transporter outer membrane subunit [Ferrimonas balearica]
MNRSLVALMLSALLATGCSMAPEYETPPSPVDEFWPESAGDADEGNSAIEDWRMFVLDPRLQVMIERALEHNRDMRIAIQTLRRAEALYGVQRSEKFPNIDIGASGVNQRLGEAVTGADSTINRQYNIDIGLFGYEIDFWGRLASLEETALQAYLATDEARRNTHIAIVSQVITAYLTLAADRALLNLARETLETQKASLALTQQSFDNGVATGLDVAQAQVTVAIAQVDMANFNNRVAADINALAVLVGTGYDPILLPDGSREIALGPVEVGMPSAMLVQRPDIRSAEHSLRGANANIGAARAAFFPNISLTATAGLLSAELDDLFSGDARSWNFTPSITAPIFHWGELRGNLEVAKADREIALNQYEQTIQLAFQEVADALAARENLEDQYQAQQQLVMAYKDSYELSDLRFRQGVDDFFSVLDSQRNYYQAEQDLISLRLSQQANLVALFRAMGGGWVGSEPPPEAQ